MKELIVDKNKCYGCGACYLKCPMHCIEMKEDSEGFLYPYVDSDRCINCHQCEKVCPVINEEQNNSRPGVFDIPKAVGGWNKNIEVRNSSSSGGAFSLFAEYILQNKGIVVGCELNEAHEAVHICVDNKKDLERLKKSKYVQSNLRGVYSEIQKFLDTNRKVLFVGTPCQVAGLKSYLDKEYEELYTIDFICNGVPSPGVFRRYIEELEKNSGSKIVSYSFRNKDHGWNQSGLQLGTKIEFEDGTIKRNYPAFRDSYMNGFLSDICLRPSCYECQFKQIPNTHADFTIGDFWGVNSVKCGLNDGKGTSLVLIHNVHAEELWQRVENGFEYKEVEFEAAIEKNHTLIASVKKNRKRENFFKELQEKGYRYTEKKYMTAFAWFRNKIVCILRGRIGQFIKFGLVGVSNTIICLLVYYLLIYAGVNYLVSYTCGFLTSIVNAYMWNSRYVFTGKTETNWKASAIKCFLSYGSTFLLSIAMVSIMVEMLDISEKIAPILKLIITIPINFFANKFWAFKDKLK